MPLRKKDTARALDLLQDYCSTLRKPEEQHLKAAIQRVVGIFRSSLFQALIGESSHEFCTGAHVHADKLGRGRVLALPTCHRAQSSPWQVVSNQQFLLQRLPDVCRSLWGPRCTQALSLGSLCS
uniref:L27-1 domain-containing protein n=1 Tax=Electrophorus electricus TaxID=8005 RepID=A0AAY5EIL5_ELEEL